MPEPPEERRDDGLEPQTFEAALARLDAIVRRMDDEDVGLEEALSLFEDGHRYLALCRERLALAQRRIEELTFEEPDASAPPGDNS